MKDLHLILDDYSEIYLTELCKYCNCKQTDLIKVLLNMAYTAARIQSKGIKPETYTDKYYITLITDIFDHLYPIPTIEEL